MTVDTRQCASAVLAIVILVAFIPAIAFANAHPHPRSDSLPYLDQSTYIRNMAVRAHVGGENRRWKMQMMSLGERRFLFQGGIPKGDVIEVTLMEQPNEPSLGAGEASQGPTAAAIANAVASATGTRIRDLPLTPARFQNR